MCYTITGDVVPVGKNGEIIAMKPELTIDKLIQAARRFCEIESRKNHVELVGVTDGKAVGTYVEHKFQQFLQSQYIVEVGNSAKGIVNYEW